VGERRGLESRRFFLYVAASNAGEQPHRVARAYRQGRRAAMSWWAERPYAARQVMHLSPKARSDYLRQRFLRRIRELSRTALDVRPCHGSSGGTLRAVRAKVWQMCCGERRAGDRGGGEAALCSGPKKSPPAWPTALLNWVRVAPPEANGTRGDGGRPAGRQSGSPGKSGRIIPRSAGGWPGRELNYDGWHRRNERRVIMLL